MLFTMLLRLFVCVGQSVTYGNGQQVVPLL